MLYRHRGLEPAVDPSAFVAPTAVVCGDVRLGARSQIGFGAVLVAEGSPVVVGASTVVRENALVRSTVRHPVHIGNRVLVGPHARLMGCTIEDEVFLATGTTVFHAARIGSGAEVRVNAVVHVASVVLPKTTVPIGWVAVGNPARFLPPGEHEAIWSVQRELDFPGTVYGLERDADGGVDMGEVTRRLIESFEMHRTDELLDG